MKKLLFYIFLLTVLVLAACKADKANLEKEKSTEKEEEVNQQTIIYEDDGTGIQIFKTDGWEKETEKKTPNGIHVTFSNDNINSIITVVSSAKSLEAVKNELKLGAGKIHVMNEKNNYLSFKSDRKESIQTEIFLKKEGDKIYVFTFIVPVKDYEVSKEKINSFIENISI